MISPKMIGDARLAYEAALKTVSGVQYYPDPAMAFGVLPGVTVGPPGLRWESIDGNATAAVFLVYVIVPADAFAIEKLLDLVPIVADAIDTMTDAAVMSAVPAAYVSGGLQYPSYEITTEYPL